MRRRLLNMLGLDGDDMGLKYKIGEFVGDGTPNVYLDVEEEPDIISVVRSDAENISNGLSRGVFGMSITRDMYYATSYISNDGAVTASNGGHGKSSGLHAASNLYAEMTENVLHVYCNPSSRPFANGITYEYVCIKYIQ